MLMRRTCCAIPSTCSRACAGRQSALKCLDAAARGIRRQPAQETLAPHRLCPDAHGTMKCLVHVHAGVHGEGVCVGTCA
jgi:hypothetical protein